MSDIKTIVVYHSGYGHTQRMAQAVAAGAQAQLLAIDEHGNLPEGGWEQLDAADAIIFGPTVNLDKPRYNQPMAPKHIGPECLHQSIVTQWFYWR